MRYTDGDDEELDEEELRRVLVYDTAQALIASREAPSCSQKRACLLEHVARVEKIQGKQSRLGDESSVPMFAVGTKVRKVRMS